MATYKTSLTPKDIGNDLNALRYLIRKEIKNMVNTLLVVKVIAVNGERLDVKTVLKDLYGNGQLIDTYEIPNVRYLQWQYGQNAIKATPKVGDIGLLLISQQDISGLIKIGISVCQTSSSYNVGDGIYIGGLLGMNQEPTQSIEFSDDNITVTGTGTININTVGNVSINSTEGNIEMNASAGSVTINSTTATVNATSISLGGDAATAGVARIGDSVNPQTMKIETGSEIVKSL